MCRLAWYPNSNTKRSTKVVYRRTLMCWEIKLMLWSSGSCGKLLVRIANFWARIKPTAPLSVLNKENSIESSCISCTLLIQLLHGLCTTFPWLLYDLILCDITLWHHSCDMWLCHVTLSCTPSLYSKSKRKRKEKNINNNLTILPSHDKDPRIGFEIRKKGKYEGAEKFVAKMKEI